MQVFIGTVVEGDPGSTGHVIQTTPSNGSTRQILSYKTERIVGNGSFGVVFQASCIETGETVGHTSLLCFQLHMMIAVVSGEAVDLL